MPSHARVSAGGLRPFLADRHPGLETQAPDGLCQERRTASLGVQQDHRGGGPKRRHHQSGQSGPRTQVQEDWGGWGDRPEAATDGEEPFGVLEVSVNRARAEKAGSPGLLEKLLERGRMGRIGRGAEGGRGRIGAGHRPVRTPGR